MHFKHYFVEFAKVRFWITIVCIHVNTIKDIDTIPAILFIPLAKDAGRAFWCFIVVQIDEK